jgi:hypothetical protein
LPETRYSFLFYLKTLYSPPVRKFATITTMAVDFLPQPLILIPAVAFLAYVIYSQLTAKSTTPSHLPWVGLGDGFFALARARWRALQNTQNLLNDAYFKVYVSSRLSNYVN